MPEVNLHRAAFEGPNDDDPPGFRSRWARLGPSLGAEKLGATVYELPPGEAICPYHYEYPNEEWLIVLEGDPTLRTPDGERTLEPGDVVCFPTGPAGAHAVRGGTGTARVVMLSTKQKPDVSVYPDSDKIGVFPGNDDDTRLFRRRDAVPYMDGEGPS
ncbi:MAG: cupin domain-containing protein [Pseudomonadota bacterium]